MDDRSSARPVDRSMAEQARFLSYCLKHEITVTVFVQDGLSFPGIVRGFDKHTLLLGYRDPNKIPKLIMTKFVTLIRADQVLKLREEFNTAESASKRKRSKRQRGQREPGCRLLRPPSTKGT